MPAGCGAVIVAVLREASSNGDSLLSTSETLQRSASLDLAHPCIVTSDWPSTNRSALDGVVELVEVIEGDSGDKPMSALQLTELNKREVRLRTILSRRAGRPSTPVDTQWTQHLVEGN